MVKASVETFLYSYAFYAKKSPSMSEIVLRVLQEIGNVDGVMLI